MNSPDLAQLTIARDQKAFKGKGRGRRRWVIGAVVVIAAAGIYAALRGGGGATTVETTLVAAAFPSQSITVLNATGRVTAQRKAAVSTKASGRLEYLGVQEGSVVKAGQVLARIENRDVAAANDQAQAALRAAQANLEQGAAELRDADANLKRSEDLHHKNFISGAALDTARARADKARAAVASLKGAIGVAEANLRASDVSVEQTLIRAPFDGVVLTKNANVGDIITPFSSAADSKGAVVNMADMATLEVEADVSEVSLSKIAVAQPVEIQLDAFPELRLLGKVSRIVPTVDRSKATVLVKVEFVERDKRVLPDMSAKVAFLSRELQPGERSSVTAVQAETLAKREGRDVVFLLQSDKDGDKARQVPVTVGGKVGDLMKVSGVKSGDKVILKPSEKLVDGSKVALLKK
ncbi:MAG: efflux RND transporter periplasmic adaptor subunit [Betaproteobacteria bacterium]|nr:efflux RND transporter periplasmic adaptor subunit [Betaproteobacteria bacterium]